MPRTLGGNAAIDRKTIPSIAMVEDEARDREMLCSLLRDIFADADGGFDIAEFSDQESFLGAFLPGKYDVLLIDIFLGASNGMELARQIREMDSRVSIVFLTNSADYAVESYGVRAAYYLLKPITREKLTEALDICVGESIRENRYIEIVADRKPRRLRLGEILFAVKSRNAILLRLSGETVKVYTSFVEFSPLLLRDERFLQSYYGCLVNMDYIVRSEADRFVLSNGESVSIKTRKAADIREAYHRYAFMRTMNASGATPAE